LDWRLGYVQLQNGRKVQQKQKGQWRLDPNSLKATERTRDLLAS